MVDPDGGWGSGGDLDKATGKGMSATPEPVSAKIAFEANMFERAHGPLVIDGVRIYNDFDYVGILGVKEFLGNEIKFNEPFYGINIYKAKMADGGGAVTLPPFGIFIDPGYYSYLENRPDPNELLALKQHEFGHFLQWLTGSTVTYYCIISPYSIGSTKLANNHQKSWTEKGANTLAHSFFGSRSLMGPRYGYQIYQKTPYVIRNSPGINPMVYPGYPINFK